MTRAEAYVALARKLFEEMYPRTPWADASTALKREFIKHVTVLLSERDTIRVAAGIDRQHSDSA